MRRLATDFSAIGIEVQRLETSALSRLEMGIG